MYLFVFFPSFTEFNYTVLHCFPLDLYHYALPLIILTSLYINTMRDRPRHLKNSKKGELNFIMIGPLLGGISCCSFFNLGAHKLLSHEC